MLISVQEEYGSYFDTVTYMYHCGTCGETVQLKRRSSVFTGITPNRSEINGDTSNEPTHSQTFRGECDCGKFIVTLTAKMPINPNNPNYVATRTESR